MEEEFERLERILSDIRANTKSPWWKSLLSGLLYGVGAVIGTILTVALTGWLLSTFGFIPEFKDIAHSLQIILNRSYSVGTSTTQ
jgi:hypothetical protein